jgi:glycosyltransferase involved in cell wall biosynthesis
MQAAIASENPKQCWHILTCEYPPQPGGVSDYTSLVAAGLADAGDEVHIWCPGVAFSLSTDGPTVHRMLRRIKPGDLHRLSTELNAFPVPRRLLLQWVPHGYGYRSMNLPFCLWLWARSVFRRDEIDIMVHEPFLAFREGNLKQDLAGVVHRIMTMILLRSTRRVWVSTPKWIEGLRPYALGRKISFEWLPVPSNVPIVDNPVAIREIRRGLNDGDIVFGHFGAFGTGIASLLQDMVPCLLRAMPNATMLLLGPGGERFRAELIGQYPEIAGRIVATGYLSLSDISLHISACDVMVQPFPDGVTTRRGSVMAALSHGRATITTFGRLSEPFWSDTSAVALHPPGDLQLFMKIARQLSENAAERSLLGHNAKTLYAERFDIRHTVEALPCIKKEELASCGS